MWPLYLLIAIIVYFYIKYKVFKPDPELKKKRYEMYYYTSEDDNKASNDGYGWVKWVLKDYPENKDRYLHFVGCVWDKESYSKALEKARNDTSKKTYSIANCKTYIVIWDSWSNCVDNRYKLGGYMDGSIPFLFNK